MLLQQERRSVAVLRFGAAGDVLLTAPIVLALRRAWPHWRIIFVTHTRNAELVSGWPMLDAVLALRKRESILSLRRRLLALNIEAVLDLHGSLRSKLLAIALGRGIKKATWQKRSWRESLAVRLGHAPYRPRTGQVRRYHTALEQLCGYTLPRQAHLHVPAQRHLEEGRTALLALDGLANNAPPQRPLVVLNPGAAWATKRWPPEHFAALARLLVGSRVRCVVLGSPSESALVDDIVARAPGAQKLLASVSFAGLAGIFKDASALVTGDTGPMHLARGMKLPCVVLFGSTPAAQFDLTGHAVITASEPCSPCSFFGRASCPKGHFRCMREIQPESVFEALMALVPKLRVD